MRDTAPAVLAGLILGWLAREAWPELGSMLAVLGLN